MVPPNRGCSARQPFTTIERLLSAQTKERGSGGEEQEQGQLAALAESR